MLSLQGRSLISVDDLTSPELTGLLKLAEGMADAIGFGGRGKRTPISPLDRILAGLFYEPSTRTRLSFESAMLRLGGQVLGFAGSAATSAAKGETLADTVRICSGYADILVMRHPLEGAAKLADRTATVPLINGGDGAHLHPTQTLADLFLLKRRLGKFDGLTVGLLGDLRHGRTVHSLAPTLARLGASVICIAPKSLGMPAHVLSRVAEVADQPAEQVCRVDDVLSRLDALYVTRVQRERFEDPGAYEGLAGAYTVNADLMKRAPANMLVMHPLPRVDEIDPEVDSDPRAVYFEQADGGVPMRMALISALLGLQQLPRVDAEDRPLSAPTPAPEVTGLCANDRCVSNMEPNVDAEFATLHGQTVCAFCDRPIA